MAKNEIFKFSDWIPLPVAEGTQSGEPVVVGDLTGVAQTHEGGGGNDEGYASIALTGAFEVAADGAAIDVGAPVYVSAETDPDPGDPRYTVAATGDMLLGHAITAKASGDAERFTVRLAGHGTTGA